MLGAEIRKMDYALLWGKMDRRMDQIERHVQRAENEGWEEEERGREMSEMGRLYGEVMDGMWWDGEAGDERYEGTGGDWSEDEEDSGAIDAGTETTRSVTVESWLDGIQ